MSNEMITRRRILGSLALSAAAVALVACGGAAPPPTEAPKAAAPAPTTAPASSGAAPAPTTAPAAAAATSAPAAAATQTAPQAAAPAAGGGAKIPMKVAVWEMPARQWMTPASKAWAAKNPDVDLTLEVMVYNDFAQKQLALLATGTLQDVFYSGIKWFPTTASKGGMLALDDLTKTKDPGLDDFVPAALQGSKFEGKLMALPFETQPGNYNAVMINKDYFDSKGIKYPTEDWTYEQFSELAAKLTDPAKKIWGTDAALFSNYYDFTTISYAYGGSLLSDDAKKFQLTTDPASVKAAQWHYDLLNKLKAAPLRGDRDGLTFASGRVAMHCDGIQGVKGTAATIGDKFKWDVLSGPTGPTGLRGSDGFVSMYSVYAKTKYPEKSFDLASYLTSKDVQLDSFVREGQPPSRRSVWQSDEAQKVQPIWGRFIKWMTDPKTKGPFPHPANLRFAELQDKWSNTSSPLFYGEVPFDQGMKACQDACQAIMDLPHV
jgi:multiple sugar transport system substrate-binding protein